MNKFKVAFRGLKLASQDKSICIQFIIACITVLASMIVGLSLTEWMFVIIAIGLVVVSEILNSCIEHLANKFNVQYDEDIRDIKDLASAAVLFASFIAILIAVGIVLNKI